MMLINDILYDAPMGAVVANFIIIGMNGIIFNEATRKYIIIIDNGMIENLFVDSPDDPDATIFCVIGMIMIDTLYGPSDGSVHTKKIYY